MFLGNFQPFILGIFKTVLTQGRIQLSKHPKKQSNDEYAMMRKFAIILLRDIIKSNKSLVWHQFSEILNDEKESAIIAIFKEKKEMPDDDISVSVDQTSNLSEAITNGLKFPELDREGEVDYYKLLDFLESLCSIFKWEVYEKATLGKVSKDGSHGKLRWYAVILSQWIKGTGLSFIMEQALEYKREHPQTGVMMSNRNFVPYDDTLEHRNIVISDTLYVIDNIVLFSISNYFLRFSMEYKRLHNLESFPNDWYEYVEYGTTNPLSITLQRNGFSREASTYIKKNRAEYVVRTQEEGIKLRRSLANCRSTSVRKEVADVQYNIPELFIN